MKAKQFRTLGPMYITLILCLYSCTGSDLSNSVSVAIDQMVTENELPGLNLSICFNNGEQYTYSSGFADIENGIRLDTFHVMFSGSIGKTYAAAVILQLVDEGKIQLQDKLFQYFPDVEWLGRLPNIEEITIEMLLQHTSGLPRYVLKPGLWEQLKASPDKIWTCRDRMSYIFDDQPVHEPGKGWSYSDSNYILLGMLIEKVCGSEYYHVVKTRILQSQHLVNTYPADKRNINNLPQGYSKLPEMFQMPDKVVEEGVYIFNPQMEWTGGGIASTTSDLARWAKIYYEGTLFSDSLLLKIITPNSQGRSIEPDLSYGMGSFIYSTNEGLAFGHTGFVPGFRSIFAYFPDHNFSIAIQINSDFADEKTRLIDYVSSIVSLIH